MSRATDAEQQMTTITEGREPETAQDVNLDQASSDKMNKLWEEVKEKKEAEKKRAAALAAIPVKDEDINLLASSLNISSEEAKATLQKKKGDVVAVLREEVGLPKASKTA